MYGKIRKDKSLSENFLSLSNSIENNLCRPWTEFVIVPRMELVGNIKNYLWGKKGAESAVAQLHQCNSKDFVINENENYAELWMGGHVSGPSLVKSTGEDLQSFISKQQKDIIGGHDSLPFLFKVLSVRQALSIQVHPNKVSDK